MEVEPKEERRTEKSVYFRKDKKGEKVAPRNTKNHPKEEERDRSVKRKASEGELEGDDFNNKKIKDL